MDPSSVIGAFKDAYLITRFVYRTIKAARSKDKDWQDLESKFCHELTLLGYHGRTYLQHDGVIDEHLFHDNNCTGWLCDYKAIFERLQQVYVKYEKIARQQDSSYQKYCSLVAPVSRNQLIGFGWELDDDSNDIEPAPLGQQPKKGFKGYLQELKFVLFQRTELEGLLAQVSNETARLQDWIPFIEKTHPRYRSQRLSPEQLNTLISGAITREFGQHRQIRQITIQHPEIRQIAVLPEVGDSDILESPKMITVKELLLGPSTHLEPAEGSGLTCGTLSSSNQAPQNVLVEYKKYFRLPTTPKTDPFAPAEAQNQNLLIAASDEIQRLALLLASSGGPTFHTLPFRGYANQPDKSQYAFIFDYPRNCHQGPPTSLHDLFSSPQTHTPIELTRRFHLARTLANTLGSIHADGWVHKSIRSNTIVFFAFKSSKPDTRKPYLVGFEYSRPAEGPTWRKTDTDVANNIYRHPRRQNTPLENFTVTHDIYALGVVLLEIGLWKTAIQIYQDGNDGKEPVAATMNRTRETFKSAAREKLPHSMGHAYAEAVCKCLSDDFKDMEFMTNFGVLFVENVVKNLGVDKLGTIEYEQEIS